MTAEVLTGPAGERPAAPEACHPRQVRLLPDGNYSLDGAKLPFAGATLVVQVPGRKGFVTFRASQSPEMFVFDRVSTDGDEVWGWRCEGAPHLRLAVRRDGHWELCDATGKPDGRTAELLTVVA